MKNAPIAFLLVTLLLSGIEMVLLSRQVAYQTATLAQLTEKSYSLQKNLLADFSTLPSLPKQVAQGAEDIQATGQAVETMLSLLEEMGDLTRKINREVRSITGSTVAIQKAAGLFQGKLTAFAKSTEGLGKEGTAMTKALGSLTDEAGKMVSSLRIVQKQMKRKTIQKLLKSLKKK